MIIAGHARWESAPLAGLTEVPTILIDDLTDAEMKAFTIADNRLAELASWDDAQLAQQLLELATLVPDLDLELTGFDVGEIDFRIESLRRPAQNEVPDEADGIAVPAGPPVTKPGDVWNLGPHRILCGDARDAASYGALLGADRARAVFTDAPYNVRIDGHASGLGKIRHREFAMAAGEMTAAQYTNFLTTVFGHLGAYCADGSIIYTSLDWRHLVEFHTAARAVGFRLLNVAVWVKHTPGMGSFYRSQHELILVLKTGRGSHRNNIELGQHGRNRSNAWFYRGANDFARGDGETNALASHPTPKPVAMVADAIMDCTARGDIVLDAFLGGGATLIAAERTGRRCFGIDIDPIYVDTAVRRWQAWTRNTAHHAVSGRSFDAVPAQKERRRGR